MNVDLNRIWHEVKTVCQRYPFLKQIESAFPEGEIYLVGGAVRDMLLSHPTKDYDFLIRGISAPDLEAGLSRLGKVSWVGKNFGVYKFMPFDLALDEPIDIALPRTEQSFSQRGAYRDFHVTSDPSLPVGEDLARRDFTLNAIAIHLKEATLIDPFGGIGDLQAGLLRAVGEPGQRFSEDTSRILRGLRLSCQLRFCFEEATWKALCEGVKRLDAKWDDGSFIVPRETIAREFIKAMISDPTRAFDLWDESGAFSELMPELLAMKGCPQPTAYHTEGDVWTHTRLALSQLVSPEFQNEFTMAPLAGLPGGAAYDAEVVLGVLFHDIGKPATLQTPEQDGVDRIRFNNHDKVGAQMTREIVKRLKLASMPKETPYHVDEESLSWLIAKHLILVQGEVDKMRAATIERNFLNPHCPGEKLLKVIFCDGKGTLPQPGVPQLVHYRQLRERIKQIQALSQEKSHLPSPLLTGEQVMEALHCPPGRQIGKALALLREEQLSGRISDAETAITFLRTLQRE